MNKPTRWQTMKIKLRLGHPFARVENLGQLRSHTVIRFKDVYLDVMERADGTLELGWADDPHMFPDVNINEFWTAVEPGEA